jgi:hypothetical protein
VKTTIDDAPLPPPQEGLDRNYITHDLEIALEAEIRALVDLEARGGGGRRKAYARVVVRLRALRLLLSREPV